MGEAMLHRGPDGVGFYQSPECHLLHRLLRIVDKNTEPGPYISRDGRWALSYNGEIYNHAQLKQELEKTLNIPWRHHSDAEILLEGWAAEGKFFLSRVNGMFAFALWDQLEKKLYLGRDRLGEKPLYYSLHDNQFFFASEIKALMAAGVPMRAHKEKIPEYLAYRYVSGPETLFASIYKLMPGHLMTIHRDLRSSIEAYWTLPQAQTKHSSPQEFLSLFEDSVKLRVQSIWEPALYLSEGIDSASIASFMPEQSRALTFSSPMTIAEVMGAKKIAQQFHLQHHEVQLQGSLVETATRALWMLEEPLGDSIIIPSHSLAQAASNFTRVVLSGEGADEILGGYVHHFVFEKLKRIQNIFGSFGLHGMQWLLKSIPTEILNHLTPYPAALGTQALDRLIRILENLRMGHGPGPDLTTLFPLHGHTSARSEREWKIHQLKELLTLDISTWLPDYTLARTDKILMGHSVEGRLPFLDHRLVEYTAHLPNKDFILGKNRKVILRKAIEGRLGKEGAWRKKNPFILNLALTDNSDWITQEKKSLSKLKNRGLLPSSYQSLSSGPSFLHRKEGFALFALDQWCEIFGIKD